MCSINHSIKAIFIHIPKNGGSYIAEILSKHYGFKNHYLQRPDHSLFCGGKDSSVDKHENKIHGTLIYYKTSPKINQILGMDKKKWDTYFIFTFIRNPYDRIVSGWNYCNKSNIPFKQYLEMNIQMNQMNHQNNIINSYDYWHVFMPQTRHLIDINGKIRVDFIGKLENIEDDLAILLNKLGFRIIHKPFIKNAKKHNDYITYYDDEIYNIVQNLMKEDFNNPLFEY